MSLQQWMVAVLLVVSNLAVADNSDYVWNEQFAAKLVMAQKGDRRAQYDVGNMYIKGQGTTKNASIAFDWIGKSAQQGYVKAKYKLGFMNLKGIGTNKDLRQANKWLTQAASENYAPAQFALAGMYSKGLYVKQDYAEAIQWLKKAKASGFWKASKELQRVSALASNTKAPAPVAKIARPAPVIAKPSVPAQQVEEDEPALSAIVLSGKWSQGGKPARFLPSSVSNCQLRGTRIVCQSNQLKGQNNTARFAYRIEVTMKDFTEAGEFSAVYQNNILSVEQLESELTLPDETDEGEVLTEEEKAARERARAARQISVGLQATVHSLECQLENIKKISCIKDHGRTIQFTRQ